MDIILLERIARLGQMGDVVRVKDGYARNFLLPQGKALRANEANKKRFESERVHLEARNLERKQEAEAIFGKVNGQAFVIIRQAGETGHLYGSVSPRDVAAAATAGGVTIERSQVLMDRPIKMLGLHPVRVALHPEVIVTITANVAKSEEEAEIQKKAGGFVPPTTEEQPSLDEVLAEADQAAAGEGEPAEAEPPAEEAAEAKPKKKAKADKEAKAEKEPKAEKPKREKKAKGKKAEEDDE